MKHLLLFLLIYTLSSLAVTANDGVFYVNGNHLVPVQETDIALSKELLTIGLTDDGYARVDVRYELTNHGVAKTVVMGFEANAPYNDDVDFCPSGIHPYISNFTVEMNGEELTYMNAVVQYEYSRECNFQPLNLKNWKAYGQVKMKDGDDLPHNALLYNTTLDSLTEFSYAYYFVAHFRPGLNTIHHTYRYRMSYGIGRTFEVPYWLTPARRWQGGQIDDFTLRIKAENTAKHFFLADSLFSASTFTITEGTGKMRKNKLYDEGYMPYSYFDEIKKNEANKRILRNLPYAHRGYVFKDKKLQRYFQQFWWYMPDPTWQPATDDFTPREWRLIREAE